MAIRQLTQGQVPDGMVANCPWGFSLNQWTDKMIERGVNHLEETDGAEFFPRMFASIVSEAASRRIEL